MEAIELWHAERLADLVRVSLPLREIEYGNPIRAADLPWLSGAPVLDAARLEWIPASSLASGRTGWLPRDLLELHFSLAEEFRPAPFFRSSNGLAAGNCRAEALLHALCEVVERHALHLAAGDPGRRLPLAPGSVEEPACRAILAAVRAAGMKASLFDVTWEAGVPAVAAEVVAPDLPNVWLGAGCHPSPEVALARALTEAAQSRLTYISGARDDLTRLPEGRGHRTFEAYAEARGERRLEDLPDLATADVEEDLSRVVGRLADLGYEPFWVDLTRPEIGLPVVRVFVPGLFEVAYH
jgi:ribosomal protein S12 methylthiotransferase accessory factor